MTQNDETRAAVMGLLQAIGAGDPAATATHYAEQVTWKVGFPADEQDGSGIPWVRPRSTRADMEDLYRTLAKYHVPGKSKSEIHAILVDGADAAVVGQFGQTLRHNNVFYTSEFILYLTVVDGLVTRHHIIEDNMSVKRAFDTAA
ncbi:hypothetical protein FB565_006185 [Actinoplanes lutulentus]|uniref:nuclear transport factor 2 family protein n=1 Tax=Actinoplanes lutulentus TaxID=1287878 RepID=UPI001827EA3C|nr:nuclear transport factor 2 family protein [Actinoplanes lutulentus]MBB2946417.1 hypothetical protein [Actinoplanes lutulentus]